jgi:hypothetical protein
MWVLTLLLPIVLLGLMLLMERLERGALVLPDLWSFSLSNSSDPDEVEQIVGQRLRPMVARVSPARRAGARAHASR